MHSDHREAHRLLRQRPGDRRHDIALVDGDVVRWRGDAVGSSWAATGVTPRMQGSRGPGSQTQGDRSSHQIATGVLPSRWTEEPSRHVTQAMSDLLVSLHYRPSVQRSSRFSSRSSGRANRDRPQVHGNLFCRVADEPDQLLRALGRSGRIGNADRGDAVAVAIEDRCGHALHPDVVFFAIERVAAGADGSQFTEQLIQIGDGVRSELSGDRPSASNAAACSGG